MLLASINIPGPFDIRAALDRTHTKAVVMWALRICYVLCTQLRTGRLLGVHHFVQVS